MLSPVSRTIFRSAPIALRLQPRTRLQTWNTSSSIRRSIVPLVVLRGTASSVSGRPASQTPAQAAQNIKEETSHAASDFAKSIAGGNMTTDAVQPENETFLGITSSVATQVPTPIMVFGLAGAIPYLGASATTVYLAQQAGLAAAGATVGIDPGVALTVVDQALNLQVTYGAVMLSFLGALHWGMEFAEYGGKQGYARLALGAAPVLYAWPTLTLQPTSALIVQWIGFTGLWYADLKATSAGWAPKWYSQYRFYLSVLVGSCIIGSLAGISLWGPIAGHGFERHDLDVLRAERNKHRTESVGSVGGDIESDSAGEGGDYYIVIRKRQSKAEEGESGEE